MIDDQRSGLLCVLHNADQAPPSDYLLVTLPGRNEVGVCAPCAAWWRAEDPASIEAIRSRRGFGNRPVPGSVPVTRDEEEA